MCTLLLGFGVVAHPLVFTPAELVRAPVVGQEENHFAGLASGSAPYGPHTVSARESRGGEMSGA
eukprot:1925202-Prymnesium_polylepis.1